MDKTIASYKVSFTLVSHTGANGPKHPCVVLTATSFDNEAAFPAALRTLAFTIPAGDFQRQQNWSPVAVPTALVASDNMAATWNHQSMGADFRIAIGNALDEQALRYFSSAAAEATKVNGEYAINLVGRSSLPTNDPNVRDANRLDPSTASPAPTTSGQRRPRSMRKNGASAMLNHWF